MSGTTPDSFTAEDERFMRAALAQAAQAERQGEVPVGAVIVSGDTVIAESHNRVISEHDASAHAEIMAMRKAGDASGNYPLPGTTLNDTLEPCAMSVGAMIHARIERLVFAASDPKTGALGGAFSLPNLHAHNHVIDVTGGVLAAEASDMLRAFFRKRR